MEQTVVVVRLPGSSFECRFVYVCVNMSAPSVRSVRRTDLPTRTHCHFMLASPARRRENQRLGGLTVFHFFNLFHVAVLG